MISAGQYTPDGEYTGSGKDVAMRYLVLAIAIGCTLTARGDGFAAEGDAEE